MAYELWWWWWWGGGGEINIQNFGAETSAGKTEKEMGE
jgi:hypothetical protein